MGEEKKDERASTVRGRELGAALRRALSESDNGPSKLAKKLHWSPSKVSNLLAARRGTSEADVAAFLALCGVVGKERDRLLRLAREIHDENYLVPAEGHLATDLRTLINHEQLASAITNYHPSVIPGLLQTGEYARALLLATEVIPKEQVDKRVAVRISRQEILSKRDACEFTFFIGEYALRRIGPGPSVMAAQLHHLLRMAVRPNITVQVIPVSIGFPPACGPFALFTFDALPQVAFAEGDSIHRLLGAEGRGRSLRKGGEGARRRRTGRRPVEGADRRPGRLTRRPRRPDVRAATRTPTPASSWPGPSKRSRSGTRRTAPAQRSASPAPTWPRSSPASPAKPHLPPAQVKGRECLRGPRHS